jgi:MoaA/NifB/PqqE/SkfB family radical SAM enzyme
MRTVTININRRCPLRCKHCSVRFSESFKGDDTKINPNDLERIVKSIDNNIYKMILLAGGEPSLDPDLIKLGINGCKEVSLKSGIITAPVWARSRLSAKDFLNKIRGLDVLIISYDFYHLEFLNPKQYEIAVIEANNSRIPVIFHIVYANEREKQELINLITQFKSEISHINAVPVVRFGNASNQSDIEVEFIHVESIETLMKIPRSCVLGNAFIERNFRVHGCCWLMIVDPSPFVFASQGTSIRSAFQRLEGDPIFQTIMKKGFIDSLTQCGKEALLKAFKGKSFFNECDLCISFMKKAPPAFWSECIRI